MAALTANFEADFSKFNDAVQQAVVELDGFEKGAAKAEAALDRMASRFSGEKVIQDATLMAEAIERLGGVSTLTEAELARVGKTANEAVDKMTALGLDVPKNLQSLADATRGASQETESLGVSVANLAASYITAEVAIRLVEGAYHALVDATKAVIASASDAEETDAALLAALQAQGTAVPSVVAAYDQYAHTLQDVTRYSAGAVKETERILAQIGGVMPRDMARATKATADLATVLHIDLSAAATMVAKAAEGQTTSLKKAGIVIKETSDGAADFGDVLTQLEAKIGGAAEAAGTTFSGELDKLSNAWDNVLEATGRVITNNATARRLMEGLTDIVEGNTTELNGNATANERVSEAVIFVARGLVLAADGLDVLQHSLQATRVLLDSFAGAALFVYEGLQKIELATQKPLAWAGSDEAAQRVREAGAAMQWASDKLDALNGDINASRATSAAWHDTIEGLKGELSTLADSLDATRGQTVALTTAQAESTDVWERQTGAIDAQTMAAQEHAKAMEGLSGKYVKIGTDVTALAKATEDAAMKQVAAMNAVTPAVDATDDALLQFTDEVTVSAEAATDAIATMGGTFDATAHSFADLTDAARSLTQEWINYAYLSPGSVPRGTLGQSFFVDPSTGTIQPRAAGGPVAAGTPYMVGEQGPELFVPGSSGAIVPAGAGGATVNIAPGAFVLNYPIVNNPAALDQLARTVGDALMTKLTRAGVRL
jgi:hypothetical protein